MPKEKLYVTGMPVSSRFCTVLSKEEARKALNLPLNKRIYLVMTGGIGCGDALNLCRSIRRIPDKNALLCVLPGRNEELRQALMQAFPPEEVCSVPFTDQVPAYMRASDVLLSKAGGISSSEAAVLGIPLVHTMAIPGVETLNASFFEIHGMSLFAGNFYEAARFADRLLFDRELACSMLQAQNACIPKDGAMAIARRIVQAR